MENISSSISMIFSLAHMRMVGQKLRRLMEKFKKSANFVGHVCGPASEQVSVWSPDAFPLQTSDYRKESRKVEAWIMPIRQMPHVFDT